MACNVGMKRKHPDADLISSCGGVTAVANKLWPGRKNNIQRVFNWTVRGIPARVRLDRPDIFGEAPPRKRKAA